MTFFKNHIFTSLAHFAFAAILLIGPTHEAIAESENFATPDLSISIIKNAPKNISINDVCCGVSSGKFQALGSNTLQIGYGMPSTWIKISGIENSGTLAFGILVEKMTLYYWDKKSARYEPEHNGKLLPPEMRETIDPDIHFNLDADQISKPLYARFVQLTSVPVNPKYLETASFLKLRYERLIIHTLLLGAVFIMMVFNLSLGIINRDALFILNMATIAGGFVSNLAFTGIGPIYIWPAAADASVTIFSLSIVACSAFAALFLYKYLDGPGRNPLIVRLILVIPALFIGTLLIWLVAPLWISHLIFAVVNTINLAYALFVLFVLWFRNDRRVKLILPVVLIALIPGNAMFIINIYFTQETITPFEHIIEFMMISESFLFSLVLAYRIRLAREDAINAYHLLDKLQEATGRHVLESIDFERKRVASDLHDTAGQGLMAISNRLSRVLASKKLPKKELGELRKVVDYSRNVVGDIRRISHELHPAIIDHLGWRNAIEELFNTLQETTDIEVELEVTLAEGLLVDRQKLHLYRIVQEAVSNIAKHSKASHCRALFFQENNMICVDINDNGIAGKTQQLGSKSGSLGRTIMDQRLATLEGRWELEYNDDENIVRFCFPIIETQRRDERL